jgi:E3 ubiquitin-protein ligase TRIP12
MEHTKTDHGYHENSRAVKYLLEVLTELTPEERRKFLLWVTGSPRLPVGGTQLYYIIILLYYSLILY